MHIILKYGTIDKSRLPVKQVTPFPMVNAFEGQYKKTPCDGIYRFCLALVFNMAKVSPFLIYPSAKV
jgi:hypothetical protein